MITDINAYATTMEVVSTEISAFSIAAALLVTVVVLSLFAVILHILI